jgi:hypothetical protein
VSRAEWEEKARRGDSASLIPALNDAVRPRMKTRPSASLPRPMAHHASLHGWRPADPAAVPARQLREPCVGNQPHNRYRDSVTHRTRHSIPTEIRDQNFYVGNVQLLHARRNPAYDGSGLSDETIRGLQAAGHTIDRHYRLRRCIVCRAYFIGRTGAQLCSDLCAEVRALHWRAARKAKCAEWRKQWNALRLLTPG